MKNNRWYIFALLCVLFLAVSCVSAPVIEKPQYSQWHYKFSVLYDPDQPGVSPRLDMALSLLKTNYPEEQIKFLDDLLYFSLGIDDYKDKVVREQRENYRIKLSDSLASEQDSEENGDGDEEGEQEQEFPDVPDWWYAERFFLSDPQPGGIIVERRIDTYSGGAHGFQARRYFVIDLEDQKLLKIDDFFQEYQGDETRELVYRELRKYSELEDDQPLSQGIFMTDEPELSFNFFLTQEGLGLHWDPYEIASYSEGSIEIILPWKVIRPLMLHSGMELLTKFGIFLFVG